MELDNFPEQTANSVASGIYADVADGYISVGDELNQLIILERMHWIKVFGQSEQGQADMKRFAEVFNSILAEKAGFFL